MNAFAGLELWLRANRPVFQVGYSHAVAGYWEQHLHEHMELVFHPSGNGTTSLADGHVVPFAPGTVIAYAPWQRHDQNTVRPGLDICLTYALTKDAPHPLNSCWSVDIRGNRRLAREIADLGQGRIALDRLSRAAIEARAEAVLFELLAAKVTATNVGTEPRGDQHAVKAARWMAEHLCSAWRMEEVATAVGVSYGHLRHMFRRRFGISMVQWLIQSRVNRASELLRHSNLKLSAIAQECGLANERYLCTVFRRLRGRSPASLRQPGEVHARSRPS